MKKLTSFMLGLVVGVSADYFLNLIYRFIESALNLNIDQLINYEFDIFIFWFALIFIPIIFFFLLRNSHNLKQKIVRTALFAIGNLLAFTALFFVAFEREVIPPSPIPIIIFITIFVIAIIYLIFRFVNYMKIKKSK